MAERLSFRWSYVAAPLTLFLLSLILAASIYHLLPAELASHFELDGTPDGWLSREVTMVWLLMPQLVLVLLAGGVGWGVSRLSARFGQIDSTVVRAGRVVLLMGNLIALPQLLLCFAMIDIFSYNLYQRHIMPMWVFLLLILILVTIALGVFLVYIFSKLRGGQRG
jgi:uncharacterized membrane protein